MRAPCQLRHRDGGALGSPSAKLTAARIADDAHIIVPRERFPTSLPGGATARLVRPARLVQSPQRANLDAQRHKLSRPEEFWRDQMVLRNHDGRCSNPYSAIGSNPPVTAPASCRSERVGALACGESRLPSGRWHRSSQRIEVHLPRVDRKADWSRGMPRVAIRLDLVARISDACLLLFDGIGNISDIDGRGCGTLVGAVLSARQSPDRRLLRRVCRPVEIYESLACRNGGVSG